MIARGDIYSVALDPAQGHEPRGRRPVLVVSATAFNGVMRVPVVVPITSGGGFAWAAGFAVPLDDAGLATIGVVRCDQLRALDLAARGARRVESVPEAVMDEVLAKVVAIFE